MARSSSQSTASYKMFDTLNQSSYIAYSTAHFHFSVGLPSKRYYAVISPYQRKTTSPTPFHKIKTGELLAMTISMYHNCITAVETLPENSYWNMKAHSNLHITNTVQAIKT